MSNAREFTGLNGDGWDDVNVTRLAFELTTGFADIKVIATDSVRDSLTFRELADPMVRGIDWATANGANTSGRCLLVVPDPATNCPVPLDAQNMNSYGWDGWTDINRQTHEIRAVSNQPGKLRWTAGAYQKQSSDWSWSGVLYSMNPGREMYDDVFFFNSPETSHETLFKELSFFGEVSYDLTDEWEATIGARFASLEQTFLIGVKGEQIYQDSLNVGNWATPETFERYRTYQPTELGGTDNDVVSPRLVLTWRPENMNLMAYVSYSEGYRPGGQNRGVLLDARRLDRDLSLIHI